MAAWGESRQEGTQVSLSCSYPLERVNDIHAKETLPILHRGTLGYHSFLRKRKISHSQVPLGQVFYRGLFIHSPHFQSTHKALHSGAKTWVSGFYRMWFYPQSLNSRVVVLNIWSQMTLSQELLKISGKHRYSQFITLHKITVMK